MLNKPFALLIALLLGSGCAGNRSPAIESMPQEIAGPAIQPSLSSTEPTQLVFFDSRTFDLDLSTAMRAESREISVAVPAAFNLNKIPERVDRWLYSVKDSGGAVVAKPEFPTRGVFSVVIDVVVSVFAKIDDALTFAPSERYRATLLYRPDGSVRKFVFNHRLSEVTASP